MKPNPAQWQKIQDELREMRERLGLPPMTNEHNQAEVDQAQIDELYASVDGIEKFLKGGKK